MAWRRKQGTASATPGAASEAGNNGNPYLSVDPAPSCDLDGSDEDDEGADVTGTNATSTEEMGKRLRDKDRTLFGRYRCEESAP